MLEYSGGEYSASLSVMYDVHYTFACKLVLLLSLNVTFYILFSVSETTQHSFDEAMMDGKLWIRSGNCFMMGVGGSGKRCILHAILEEECPVIRQSTMLCERLVRTLAQWKIGITLDKMDNTPSFFRITDSQFCDMLSTSARQLLRHFPQQQRDVVSLSKTISTLSPQSPVKLSLSATSKELEFPHSGFQKELLVRMNAGSQSANRQGSDRLDEMDLLDMKESGGQPMFHEILPVIVTNAMLILLIVKLNESLDSHPIIESSTDGIPLGESPFSHIQTFRHCIKVVQSTCQHGKYPKIAFIGTHQDRENECQERQATKNQRLLSIIPPDLRKHIIPYRPNSLLFPINAFKPRKNDLIELKNHVIEELLSVPRVRIPHRYIALETAFQRLAKYRNKAILSIEECFKEAVYFHFTRESLEDALIYLHSNNVIIYCREVLPKVVFIDAQIILYKINELVEHKLMLQSNQFSVSPVIKNVEEQQKFKSCGIITEEILSRFQSGYIPNLFTEVNLIQVFQYWRVIYAFGDGEYLMPCLLQEEDSHSLLDSAFDMLPPLVFDFGEDGPMLGVYSLLLSSLINDAKWKLLSEDGCPVQMSRNVARFTIPGNHPGFITLCDSLSTFFHVHITFPSDIALQMAIDVCKTVCPSIREMILTGIRRACRLLNYNDSIPRVAFLCSKHLPNSLHPATISSHGLLTCTTYPASIFTEMTEGHQIWLGEGSATSHENAGM